MLAGYVGHGILLVAGTLSSFFSYIFFLLPFGSHIIPFYMILEVAFRLEWIRRQGRFWEVAGYAWMKGPKKSRGGWVGKRSHSFWSGFSSRYLVYLAGFEEKDYARSRSLFLNAKAP